MRAREVAERTRAWLPLPPPVDVDELLGAIGARHLEAEIETDVWGVSFSTSKSFWVVTAKGLSPAERRLTVLHEAGHLMQHVGNCMYVARRDRVWASKNERQADLFAIHFGIPDELAQQYRCEWDLAEACGLPVEYCRLRLELAR